MLRFSAQFPVKNSGHCGDMWPLGLTWLDGSPHSKFDKSNLSLSKDTDWHEVESGNEHVIFARASANGYQSHGLRYTKIDPESRLKWDTQYVGVQDNNKFWVSVAVSCDSPLAGHSIPYPKKPYFIRQALDHFGGGHDADFCVSQNPHAVNESDLDSVARIINGGSHTQMPVVYISRSDNDQLLHDANTLAKWLAGMAHVVVEPSRDFSFLLREKTGGMNTYGGSVGIFWPAGVHVLRYHPWGLYDDPNKLIGDVSAAVRNGLIGQRQIEQCTWAHLNELRARAQVERLKTSDSSTIDEYINAFDSEMRLKEDRLERAENEVRRLEALLRARTNNAVSIGEPVLIAGKERNLYDSEIRDTLHEVLKSSLPNTHTNSRRKHILDDLIAANMPGTRRIEIKNTISRALSGYRKMTSPIKSELQDSGFSLSEDGKHYKLVFGNDPRYQLSFPKTSSDHRAGKNMVSEINNKLF